MSPRPRNPDGGAAAFDLPPEGEQERVEAEWLLARESDPAAPPPSAQVALNYAELEDMLRTLPEGPPDDSWHAEVLRRLPPVAVAEEAQSEAASKQAPAVVAPEPQPRPWWRRSTVRWASGAFAAAAVAAIVMVLRPPSPPAEERAIAIAVMQHAPVRSSSAKYAVGDRVRVVARSQGNSELRVFRSDGTSSSLIARCPDETACKAGDGGELALDLTLQAPGRYYAILVDGPGKLPLDATMNEFLDAAMSAGAGIPLREPFEVE